jgi:hypothetical protein
VALYERKERNGAGITTGYDESTLSAFERLDWYYTAYVGGFGWRGYWAFHTFGSCVHAVMN